MRTQRQRSARRDSVSGYSAGKGSPTGLPLPLEATLRKRRRRRLLKGRIVFLLVLSIGVGLVAYPVVSNVWYQFVQSQIVLQHEAALGERDEEELQECFDKALAWNELHGAGSGPEVVSEPDESSSEKSDEESDKQAATDDIEQANETQASAWLNDGSGVLGVVRIERLGIEQPIREGTSDEALEEGVGRLEGSSLPVGGAGTRCVLAGHTGLPSGKIFDDLDQVVEGDVAQVEVLGQTLWYRVVTTEVVLPEEAEGLAKVEGKDLLTLVTCTPYGVNSHRLLIHAERWEPDSACGEEGLVDTSLEFLLYVVLPATGTLWLVVTVARRYRRRRKMYAAVNFM